MDYDFLTTAQVAKAFGVDPRTINRWTHAGKITPAFWTPGGQRRYSREAVDRLLKDKR